MRQFRKTKRILTAEEQQQMRERARQNAETAHLTEAEKEQLVKEGKMRKVVFHPDPKTTVIRYEPIQEP